VPARTLPEGARGRPVVIRCILPDGAIGRKLGREPGHIYSRNSNPTVRCFEEKIRDLEGAQAATSFSSGMAAISATFFAFLRPGDRVVSIKDSYGGTNKLFGEFLPSFGIDVRLCDTADFAQIEAEIARGCKLLYLESPTNPTVKVVDIERLAKAAHAVGALVAVDNTFATPMLQQPLSLGASAVVHSATKYIGGHSDLLMGAVIVEDDSQYEQLVEWRTAQGAIPGVMEAYLALRGLRTLPVRFARQQRTAAELAERLDDHRHVERVRYPGLINDPGFERASSQMGGFGAMLSFEVKDADSADRVVALLRLIVGGTSLGGVESTIDRRARWKGEEIVPGGLLRLSVGLEHPVDLWADLDDALNAAFKAS